MTATSSAEENLAFVREILEGSAPRSRTVGAILLVAGAVFGAQYLVQWGYATGRLTLNPLVYRLVTLTPLLAFPVFAGVCAWIGRTGQSCTIAARAYDSGFTAAGLAAACITAIIWFTAWSRQDAWIWNMYTPIVLAVLGGSWYLAYRLRRRAWYAAVSAASFVGSLILPFLADGPEFLLWSGIAMIVLFGGPGAALLRHQPGRAAE